MSLLNALSIEKSSEEKAKGTVVRIKTESFISNGSLVTKRTIRTMKRLSDYDLLDELMSNLGARDALEDIVNINECEDGLYHMFPCNLSRDWETGMVDEWNHELIPYTEDEEQ